MDDVRLTELRFLNDLSKGPLYVRCWARAEQDTYGLTVEAFRDLVLDLLLDGCLNGPAGLSWGSPGGFIDRDASTMQAFNEIVREQPAHLKINHKGRLRLARLRVELQSNRHRDKFGILLDQRHWERDLLIALLAVRDNEPVSVMLADLDHFKALNDILGYDAGDACLRRYFTAALQVVGDRGDVYCRGGDEVLAILPRTDANSAAQVGESLRLLVEKELAPLVDSRVSRAPTASVGCVTILKEISLEDVSKGAKDQLDRSKQGGKNRVSLGTLPP